jgi:hypothetical protein
MNYQVNNGKYIGDADEIVVTATAIPSASFVAHDEFNSTYTATAVTPPAVAVTNVSSVNNLEDDDIKAKYASYDYRSDNCVVQQVTSVPPVSYTTTPYDTPYTTPYNAELERQIADEATRRGRILSEQEIEDIRRINRKADAINNQDQLKVQLANQNAFYQNYKEETGLTQTSKTMLKGAIAVPTNDRMKKEPEYFPGGTYGKGGYEETEYETRDYKTTDYEPKEYKSVYDP